MRKRWFAKYKKLIAAGKIDKAKKLLLKKIPRNQVVYKYYRGINRDWNSIIYPEIWLCQAGNFNDPFDCAFLFNCRSKDIYDCTTEYELAVEEGMKQFERDKESKSIQRSVFVACFSEKNDSLLMWSHYADEHSGICVGYNLHDLIERYDCFPVIYSNKMPQEKTIKAKEKNLLYNTILVKSKEWMYEVEWRIIDIDESKAGQNGKSIPFVTPVSIYMGKCQTDTISKNHSKFKEIKEKNPSVKSIEIFNSDEFYIDENKIEAYVKHENIELYDFDLNRSDFKLKRRTYKI
ncbi:MAG: DUF2971 domain-containing protein [Anaerostipes sp.]|jgi:hypothetical protein